ncbi:hypothetical protein [Catellatospora sp. NPDC049133]|uniref:hypothetical protein n=1 Tax=Catellatospora sp. NPDC049133 TaxID=3155499 RepID=UPI0033DA75F6
MNITTLWPTRLWLGEVDAADLAQLSALADPARDVDLTDAGLGVLADLEQAAAAVDPDAQLTWSHRLTTWRAGHYLGMARSAASVFAMTVVASTGNDANQDSGAISLHDPRVAASNVALPGLPWGRPFKISAAAGAAVAAPGWLAYSIAPLRDPHTMTVWLAEGSVLSR